jgi:GAF domain-containing protein
VAIHPHPQPATPTEALEQLGRLSLRELAMDELLQRVADLSKAVLPGHPEASVTLLVRDEPTLMASTGRLAVDLDERQYERGHGPCLDAARTGEVIEVSDARTDPRWRDYLVRAVEHGCLSSLSIPLRIDEEDDVTGALNVYAQDAEAFDDASRAVAARFGPYAAIAAGNLHLYQAARDQAENLQRALDSRAVIDQAKGVLIERYRLTPDQAFQLLARASMHTNRKVRDVADHLVRTGELLGTAPPGDGRRAGTRPT